MITIRMLASTNLAISYAMFALIATIVNIGAQELVIRIYHGPFDLIVSIIVGTGVGLVVKYILDKYYIFRFQTRNLIHNTQIFVLYTFMGLATTTIFWGFEFFFHHMFDNKEMRYFGGIIGLAIGYLTKYRLDKRYVFQLEAV